MRFLKTYAQESLQNREELADLGVFPTMLTALRAHHQLKDMQLEGMKAVAAAVFKSNRCRRLAGEAALPQYACHVLHQFAADATVVAQACTALTNLTHNSFENKDRCDTIARSWFLSLPFVRTLVAHERSATAASWRRAA